MKKRKKKKYLYELLIMLLLCIGIAYAVLMKDLNINGFSRINNATWDIYWDNVQVTTGSVTAETPQIDSSTRTTVSYEITLGQPGDFYEFTVDAVNNGSIPGKIDSITSKMNNAPITSLPVYLSYQVTFLDGTPIETNHLLRQSTRETYKVRIGYRTDINPSDLPSTPQTFTFDFTVTYVQGDDPNATFYVYNFPTETMYFSDSILGLKHLYYSPEEYMAESSSDHYIRYTVNKNYEIQDMGVCYRDICIEMNTEEDFWAAVNMLHEKYPSECDLTTYEGFGYECRNFDIWNPAHGVYMSIRNITTGDCTCAAYGPCFCEGDVYYTGTQYLYSYAPSAMITAYLDRFNELGIPSSEDPEDVISATGKRFFLRHELEDEIVVDTDLFVKVGSYYYRVYNPVMTNFWTQYYMFKSLFPTECNAVPDGNRMICEFPFDNFYITFMEPTDHYLRLNGIVATAEIGSDHYDCYCDGDGCRCD